MMPIDEPFSREFLQPNATLLDLPELRRSSPWLQLVDAGFAISTGIQPIYTPDRSFQGTNHPNRFTSPPYPSLPLPLGEAGERDTFYGVATFR